MYFDNNGKLVVETNRGMILNDGKVLEVPVEGVFEVRSTTIAKLLAHFSKSTWQGSTWGGWYTSIVTTQEEIQKVLDNEPLSAKYYSELCRKKEEELCSIKDKIREFNSSRKFYERKLEL